MCVRGNKVQHRRQELEVSLQFKTIPSHDRELQPRQDYTCLQFMTMKTSKPLSSVLNLLDLLDTQQIKVRHAKHVMELIKSDGNVFRAIFIFKIIIFQQN